MRCARDDDGTLPLDPAALVVPPEPTKAEPEISPCVEEKRACYQRKFPDNGDEEDAETKEKNRLLRKETMVMGEVRPEDFTESEEAS